MLYQLSYTRVSSGSRSAMAVISTTRLISYRRTAFAMVGVGFEPT